MRYNNFKRSLSQKEVLGVSSAVVIRVNRCCYHNRLRGDMKRELASVAMNDPSYDCCEFYYKIN